ncbi:hypothetical protein [Amycolatopsis sp. NPDC054798]
MTARSNERPTSDPKRARGEWAAEGRERHGDDGRPLYQRLVRKSVPQWPDQVTMVTQLRMILQDRRSRTGGERITDATIARIGIDLVGQFRDDLHGDEEPELTASAMAAAADLLDARDLLRQAFPDAGDSSAVELVKRLVKEARPAKPPAKPRTPRKPAK